MNFDFYSKINKEKYQITLFTCPASFPVMFARHSWLVINRKGEISRWEVFTKPPHTKTSWGHVVKDFYMPFQGINIFFFSQAYLWSNIRLEGFVEGDKNSLAHRMADFVVDSYEEYPYLSEYSLLGPNSNTYIQWILNKFPEASLSLPWNSFGKGKISSTQTTLHF
jgi:hypothetical protein